MDKISAALEQVSGVTDLSEPGVSGLRRFYQIDENDKTERSHPGSAWDSVPQCAKARLCGCQQFHAGCQGQKLYFL